jgi:hypothetical protein
MIHSLINEPLSTALNGMIVCDELKRIRCDNGTHFKQGWGNTSYTRFLHGVGKGIK